METSILEKALECNSRDCRYIDVPEFITNIKQEVVIEQECTEFTDEIKIKDEPLSTSEEQLGTNSLLLNHVKTEHTESEETVDGCNITEEKFKGNKVYSEASGGATESEIAKTGLIHRCTKCNYFTPRKNHLESHIHQHENLQEDSMFRCEYKSPYLGNLKRHIQRCKPCYKFKTGDSLLLKCSDCEYQTFDNRYLSRHMASHKSALEVRMHKCNQCEYQTKYKSNMNKHVRRHTRREELEILKCPECKYQSINQKKIDLHINRHRNAESGVTHKCVVCGYITFKKSHFKVHVLRHKNST